MLEWFASLHASRKIDVDPENDIYMAPFHLSFWKIDGDKDGERFFKLLEEILADFEKEKLSSFPVSKRKSMIGLKHRRHDLNNSKKQ